MSRHVVVVTDGENTKGPAPAFVLRSLAGRPEDLRPSVYFVAFDVAASVFADVKQAGSLVLSASNALQLQEAVDFILGEKILLEKPSGPKPK